MVVQSASRFMQRIGKKRTRLQFQHTNSAPSVMSYMFEYIWCIAIGFPALYCKIWKVIKSGV